MAVPILVVEDEPDLAHLLEHALKKAGYEVNVALDGLEAVKIAQSDPPELVVLDLMLPGLSGLEVLARLRTEARTADVPVLVLTALGDDVDQIAGFRAGADDYVVKPASARVLIARIEALMRRSKGTSSPETTLSLGPIKLDTTTYEARVGDRDVALTLTEYRLLAALISAEGRARSRSDLISKVMGPGVTVTARTIDVHITALRRKLGDAGDCIRTVRGIGYRAHDPGDPVHEQASSAR